MRNFFRVLRQSWAYPMRLIISAVAALAAAACWSLNLSTAYPILKILSEDKTLTVWVDSEIERFSKDADEPTRLEFIRDLEARLEQLRQNPNAADRENTERRTANELAKLQGELSRLYSKIAWLSWLKTAVIQHLPDSRFGCFVLIVVGLVVGIALKGVFEFIQESLVGVVVQRTLFDFRNRYFAAAVHQDFKQLGDNGTAELMSRGTNDMEQLATGLKMLYGRVMLEPFKMIGCIVGACLISWQLTLMFVLVVAVAVVTLNKVSRSMKKAARKVLERMSDLYKVLREAFDGLRVVKAFTGESRERRRFRRVNEDFYKRSVRVINIDAAVGPLLETLGVAAVGLALVAGAYLVLEKQTDIFGVKMIDDPMDFEALITLYMFLATIADPVRKLSSVYTKMQSGMVAADRIYALYDRQPAIAKNADGPVVPKHGQSIEFRDVSFGYHPGRPVINSLSLKVPAGETVALVGPNGCGKSTLLGLLPRFYDPDSGSVSVDGIDLRGANLRSLRRQLGIVTQDTTLFDDTIAANIAYGRPGATAEQIEAAATAAHAHEFIVTLPGGYEARTGDMAASKLSGGQKQRIALARAILRDPRILILDEFTSQIDGESEAKIHEALRTFVKGRTTFLITHRLSTLELADRIIVLDAGRIVAQGRHADLIAGNDVYRRLYEGQASGGAKAA